LAEKDTFIQEVDEEFRRDQALQVWRRYRVLIIALVAAVLLSVAGYQIWQNYRQGQAEAGARAFIAAQRLAQGGQHADAAKSFASLHAAGPDAYRLLAAFQEAAQLVRAKDIPGAVAAYEKIAADGAVTQEYRDLARYYAALNGFDSLPVDDLRRGLGGIAPSSPWNGLARELLAQTEIKAGSRDTARKLLTELSDDPQAPLGVRGRASELLAALGGPVGQ